MRPSVESIGFASFTATAVNAQVEEEEFIKEVEDELRRLKRQSTTRQLCREAMERFRQEKTPENKEQLRQTDKAVPKHLRMYLGDMDSIDWEYRRALGIR